LFFNKRHSRKNKYVEESVDEDEGDYQIEQLDENYENYSDEEKGQRRKTRKHEKVESKKQ
jgi:hypothetical protein